MRISSTTPAVNAPGVTPVPTDPQQGRRPASSAADPEGATLSPSLRAHIEQSNRAAAQSTVAAMNAADARLMTTEQAAFAVQAIAAQSPDAARAAHAGLTPNRVLSLLSD